MAAKKTNKKKSSKTSPRPTKSAPQVEPESIRLALEQAWRDHHHMRDQTWRTVQIIAVLAAGHLTIDMQFKSIFITLLSTALVCMAACFGILITKQHRKGEMVKFLHIRNCQEALGLHDDKYIPISSIGEPKDIEYRDMLDFSKRSTAHFIFRMHTAIFAFSVLVFISRLINNFL